MNPNAAFAAASQFERFAPVFGNLAAVDRYAPASVPLDLPDRPYSVAMSLFEGRYGAVRSLVLPSILDV